MSVPLTTVQEELTGLLAPAANCSPTTPTCATRDGADRGQQEGVGDRDALVDLLEEPLESDRGAPGRRRVCREHLHAGLFALLILQEDMRIVSQACGHILNLVSFLRNPETKGGGSPSPSRARPSISS